MTKVGRRGFVGTSLGAAAAVAASRKGAFGASNRIRVGVMGLGGRGSFWVKELAAREDVEIAYVCDVDASRFERVQGILDQAGRGTPKMVQDFREILDDPAVDAVVIAMPMHWHALPTILACQAGKDVYCEKPGFLNPWEGRQAIAAARKYERIVQVGLQNRSAPYVHTARAYFDSGRLGTLHLVRVLNRNTDRMRPKGETVPIPPTMDWDAWCGPAPLIPYSPGRWYLNRLDYSPGAGGEDAVHQLDLMRYVTGIGTPRTVVHAGGVLQLKDGRDVPDTQLVTYEYPGELTLLLESTLWANYIRETPSVIRDGDEFPDWLFNGTKIELFGSEGMMLIGRMGGGWKAFDRDGKLVDSSYGRQASSEHMTNFLECVRSRKTPNADIEAIYPSTLLVLLANTSYRVGNRKLAYDASTGWIVDDPEANEHMKRKGRAPWIIPDEV